MAKNILTNGMKNIIKIYKNDLYIFNYDKNGKHDMG